VPPSNFIYSVGLSIGCYIIIFSTGGPLITADGILVGIVSSGIGCGRPDFSGIFARVSGVTEWLTQTMCRISSRPAATCPNALPVPSATPKCFDTTNELMQAVDLWLAAGTSAELAPVAASYGLDLQKWCVSRISDFSNLFSIRRNTNAAFYADPGVSAWDMSAATNTSNMFYGAIDFNADVSGWNVAAVRDMRGMFRGCEVFDQDVGTWQVGNVFNTSNMFRQCKAFNRDLSLWDMRSVKDMRGMFRTASSFNQDISAWDVSNVEVLQSVFVDAALFNQDISPWNVAKVKDMSFLFYRAKSFNQDISKWDTGQVETMKAMFYEAASFNKIISPWKVGRVKDMSKMFFSAYNFNQNLSTWDVSNVVDMSSMFQEASFFNQDIGPWNVSKVTDMSFLFTYAFTFNQDISKWDVSNVRTMNGLFFNAQAFNQDISAWDISRLQDVDSLFRYALAFNKNLCKWGAHLTKATIVTDMFAFSGCPSVRDPNLNLSPPGPFCYPCSTAGGSTSSSESVTEGDPVQVALPAEPIPGARVGGDAIGSIEGAEPGSGAVIALETTSGCERIATAIFGWIATSLVIFIL
jgi:surface protein